MRTTLMYLFYRSPLENLKRHADIVAQCGRMLAQAVDCYLEGNFVELESITDQVARMESQADAIKRNIRGHMPRGVLMPVDKFQFFMYLKEQDGVLDAVEEALYWLSYRPKPIGQDLAEDLRFLVTSLLPAIEKLAPLVEVAMEYFKSGAEEQRKKMKSLIRDIRQHEHEADHLERELVRRLLTLGLEPLEVFYFVRLVETIGSVADHAQNASDMMRAMISR